MLELDKLRKSETTTSVCIVTGAGADVDEHVKLIQIQYN